MYRVLIVDDQYFALLGLQQGVNWDELGITDVRLAESAEQAMDMLSRHTVDLLICDIEMPGKSGLELLAWTERHSPDTRTIMLTCHADFEYAQRAIQHGAFHYLLKPVDYEQLRKAAGNAIAEVGKQKEREKYDFLMQDYRRKWEHQLPLLVERFWQDILSQRSSLHPDSLRRSAEIYGLSFEPDDRFILVLLGMEQWKEDLSARDEAIMEYALRNLAGELILEEREGAVIQNHAGLNLAIVYERRGGGSAGGSLERNCRRFLNECERLLQCSLSIYISAPVLLPDVLRAYADVTEREQRNVGRSRQVFPAEDPRQQDKHPEKRPAAAPVGLFAEWATLLELGEREELERRVKQWFLGGEADDWTKESYHPFVYGVLFIVHAVLAQKGLSVHESAKLKGLTDKAGCPRSPAALLSWAIDCLEAAVQLLKASDQLSSAVVAKVRQYIRSRLSQEITREELASHVYLNPAYLSRLFKKETGLSLSDAIIRERIREAMRLLEESELKITDIAERVGYISLGSFSNLFKRTVGVTPQQYRARKRGGG